MVRDHHRLLSWSTRLLHLRSRTCELFHIAHSQNTLTYSAVSASAVATSQHRRIIHSISTLACCLPFGFLGAIGLAGASVRLQTCAMRLGSLVLSTSKRAAVYNFLHAPLSRDLELPIFIISPASKASLKVRRILSRMLAQEQPTTSSPQSRYDGPDDPYWEVTRVRPGGRA